MMHVCLPGGTSSSHIVHVGATCMFPHDNAQALTDAQNKTKEAHLTDAGD